MIAIGLYLIGIGVTFALVYNGELRWSAMIALFWPAFMVLAFWDVIDERAD
jgi:hypothetical protein